MRGGPRQSTSEVPSQAPFFWQSAGSAARKLQPAWVGNPNTGPSKDITALIEIVRIIS